jgi:hypothetical protein
VTTLGQIVGIHKTTRTQIQRDWDQVYHDLQRSELFNGFDKTHTPFEGNLTQPAKSKRVQANATELVYGLQDLLTRLFDLEATKDSADTQARADVKVTQNGNETVVLPNVPINHLLWLEKQAVHLLTVFRSIPVVSAAEDWQSSETLEWGKLRTPTEQTPSTKKAEHFEIIVPAADNNGHPAAYEKVTQDIKSGDWYETKYTTAMLPNTKAALVNRTSLLLDGIKQAIVAANHLDVTDVKEGALIFGFLFDNAFDH